jgi:hypothetical protein
MSSRTWTIGLGLLALGSFLSMAPVGPHATADEQSREAASQEGVEPQGRGPVHEAFLETATSQPQSTAVITKQPPESVDEMPPDQKPDGDNVQWIPGYWAYDDEAADFMWVSGCWRAVPPGRQWMPGHWVQVDNGWQWTPGYWAGDNQTETDLVPPPPNNIDAGPSSPAPSNGSVYVSGTWVYRSDRFVWRAGFWYTPRPDWVWVPAHYVWTPGGYIFVEGYWDYPLRTRGLLFAPVVIERRYWDRPRWVYRPQVIVYEPALVGCLFIRPDTGGYFFGDYFQPAYRQRGFVAWIDFRVGRRGIDPLLGYYRWQHRDDRLWDRDLRSLYVSRYRGDVPRPPRTIVQQTTVINNITINKNVNITNVRNVTVMAPITRVDRTVVKLQPVTRVQMAQQQKAVQRVREAVKERQKISAQLVAKGPAPKRPTDRPVAARVQLPRQTTVVKVNTTVKTPTPPVLPRTTVKPLPKTDSVKPPVKPIRPPVTPVKPPVKPIVNPVKPPVKPVVTPVKPPVKPIVNPVKPPVKPKVDSVRPPVKPKVDSVKPPPKTDGKSKKQ